jgi:hypothetical protein
LSKAVDAATALNLAFAKCLPASQKKRMSEAEWSVALQKFHGEARTIRKHYALGPLGRAMATYQFQKLLIKGGFDAATVRKVVFSLVLNAFTASP